MKLKLFAAAALALATVAPTLADEYPAHRRHHHRHHYQCLLAAALPDQFPSQLRPRRCPRHVCVLRRPDQPPLQARRGRLYRPGRPTASLLLKGIPACPVGGWPFRLKSGNRRLVIDGLPHALVAQLDRASDFDSEGRRFESFRARQKIEDKTSRYINN